MVKVEKKSKKELQKACAIGKRCYFCTRNNGDVLYLLKAGLEEKKDSKFFTEKLARNKKER